MHCVGEKNIIYKTTAKNFTKLNLLAHSIYNNIWSAFTHIRLIICVVQYTERKRLRLRLVETFVQHILLKVDVSFRTLGSFLICQRS